MTATYDLSCFKAYDIRGKTPDQLNEELALRIGQAFVSVVGVRSVVVGRDIRLDSPQLSAALCRGLTAAGADVLDIGLCGTEEVYFQTFHRGLQGGVMVTASHNPKGYNGMKLVKAGAEPVSGDSELPLIREAIRKGALHSATQQGALRQDPDKSAYIQRLLACVDVKGLAPLKIVANPGNGCAGPVLRLLEEHLPLRFVFLHEAPDGEFPNGIPNPLLPENREVTARAVREHQADLGLAWDGDFDRCFFFDAAGRFIEGYYMVGLLAAAFLARHPGEKIVHDPRLTWNTREMTLQAGGIPVQSKSGHAFMKETMRREDALYGGEMSAHHFFRDFGYCDSGMIPWLLVAELLSRTGKPLAELVDARMAAYPCSGESNYRVADVKAVLERVERHFAPQAPRIDRTDGLGLEFADWRLNIRGSNTEPLLRLNLETRGSAAAVAGYLREVERCILTPDS